MRTSRPIRTSSIARSATHCSVTSKPLPRPPANCSPSWNRPTSYGSRLNLPFGVREVLANPKRPRIERHGLMRPGVLLAGIIKSASFFPASAFFLHIDSVAHGPIYLIFRARWPIHPSSSGASKPSGVCSGPSVSSSLAASNRFQFEETPLPWIGGRDATLGLGNRTQPTIVVLLCQSLL